MVSVTLQTTLFQSKVNNTEEHPCNIVLDSKTATNFTHYLRVLRQKKWVVYAKPPFGGPDRVLNYPFSKDLEKLSAGKNRNDPGAFKALFEKHDMEIVGPPLPKKLVR